MDAKAGYAKEGVEEPPNHLERLRGPRPSVDPWRLGRDQLILAAATCRSSAPQPPSEAVHLESIGGVQAQAVVHQSSFPAEYICWANELGK